ncbi:MAG: hypothetical protein WC941_10780 [Candidatus Bathyarchaeia archaeon]
MKHVASLVRVLEKLRDWPALMQDHGRWVVLFHHPDRQRSGESGWIPKGDGYAHEVEDADYTSVPHDTDGGLMWGVDSVVTIHIKRARA